MTLYIGIDESIIEERNSRWFIYVAACSRCSQGENRRLNKRRIRQNDFTIDFGWVDGFLFVPFLLEGTSTPKDLRKKQIEAISYLINRTITLSKEYGSLNGDKIRVAIDGSDNYGMATELFDYLNSLGYGNRSEVEFVPNGDERMRVINIADTIAYILRGLKREVDSELEDIDNIKKLLQEGTPRTRRILPFHMLMRRPIVNLEQKVA